MSLAGKRGHLKGSKGRGWRGGLCFNVHHCSQMAAEGQSLSGAHQWLDIANPGRNISIHMLFMLFIICYAWVFS